MSFKNEKKISQMMRRRYSYDSLKEKWQKKKKNHKLLNVLFFYARHNSFTFILRGFLIERVGG